jgi:hypothetical protein
MPLESPEALAGAIGELRRAPLGKPFVSTQLFGPEYPLPPQVQDSSREPGTIRLDADAVGIPGGEEKAFHFAAKPFQGRAVFGGRGVIEAGQAMLKERRTRLLERRGATRFREGEGTFQALPIEAGAHEGQRPDRPGSRSLPPQAALEALPQGSRAVGEADAIGGFGRRQQGSGRNPRLRHGKSL